MTDTTTDYDRIRDGLLEAGYEPCHAFYSSTVDYFELRGWDAVRHNGDSLSFARFGDEGSRLMTTSLSGVILAEASFSDDPHGTRMFLVSAELRPCPRDPVGPFGLFRGVQWTKDAVADGRLFAEVLIP